MESLKASLLSLILFCYSSIIIQAFDKKQCILSTKFQKTKALPPSESCPKHILDGFPDADALGFVLNQKALVHQHRVRRMKVKENKPHSNTCYQRDTAIQFNLATWDDKKTIVLWFYGTENDYDWAANSDFDHKKILLSDISSVDSDEDEENMFRVHRGVFNKIAGKHFTELLREKLMGIYFTSLDESKNILPTKLVIGGKSLGASYALMFYLLLVSEASMLFNANTPGFHFLPRTLDAITVITIGGPMIIYHEDAKRISDEVQSRIYNIINYRDPVVMALSGKHTSYKKKISYSFKSIFKHRTDDKLIKLGTNGPVGNFLMFMKVSKKSFFSFKKEKLKIVVKVLDRNEVYLNYGARCLWKNTRGGIFGGKALWKYHGTQVYLDYIEHSCVYKYLQTSKYWNAVMKRKNDKFGMFLNGEYIKLA